MALKDKWVDKVDGVDIASAEDINQVAGAVIELENQVESGGGKGEDGFSPIVSVEKIDGGNRVVITDAEGQNAFDVMDGANGRDGTDGVDGKDGADGKDYVLTETDKTEIAKEATALVDTSGFVAKNQGADNVGKILVVGTDGNLALVDMPEGGASGDVVGTLDESNNILLSGNLASGTYTLKYENADGTYTEIGTLEVGAVEPDTPVEPEVVNLFNPDTAVYNSRLGASGDLKAAGSCAGAVVTDFIDITNINKIKISGTYVANTSYSTLKYGKLCVYDANGTWLETGINFDVNPDGLVFTASETISKYPSATQIRICLSIKANETITSADVTGVVIAAVE